jgi:hypothetical protein
MPRPTHPALPPDVEAIFKKLDKLLYSDDEQNSTLPDAVRSQIAGGLECDELPGATGEFGRTLSNPIPTNGPLGEVLYLSRLRTSAGSPVMFHRVRAEEGPAGAVDVYDVLSLDATVRETLFLSMFHPRKSRKVPRGYTYADKLDPSNFTYGVNHIIPNFPQKLDAYIRKWQMGMVGLVLPVARVRETINGSRFHPSVIDDQESGDRGSEQGQMRDDLLKLVQASQDPRFEGQGIAIGTDGIVRPMARERARGPDHRMDIQIRGKTFRYCSDENGARFVGEFTKHVSGYVAQQKTGKWQPTIVANSLFGITEFNPSLSAETAEEALEMIFPAAEKVEALGQRAGLAWQAHKRYLALGLVCVVVLLVACERLFT